MNNDIMDIIYTMSDINTIHNFCQSSKMNCAIVVNFWVNYFKYHKLPFPQTNPKSLHEWIKAVVDAEKIVEPMRQAEVILNSNFSYQCEIILNPDNIQYYYDNLTFPNYKATQDRIILFFQTITSMYTDESQFRMTITFHSDQLTFTCYDYTELIYRMTIKPINNSEAYHKSMYLYLLHLIYDLDLEFKMII